ncbi:large ribosomal subunit protein bL17-like [Dysidea avara]|uniref:large ribosomal subunit protein bL17-like n=1 Tax=Dysidea avara TaxID=196820 RepID=UPI0033297321
MNLRPRIKYCRIKKAVVQDLCRSLVRDERIVTTLAKAKWMQKFGDRMIIVAKRGGVDNEKKLANFLMDKKLAAKVVGLCDRYKNRQHSYTRLFRIPNREKDQAKMGILEYVDNPYPPLPHPSVRKPPAKIPEPPSRFSSSEVPAEGTQV